MSYVVHCVVLLYQRSIVGLDIITPNQRNSGSPPATSWLSTQCSYVVVTPWYHSDSVLFNTSHVKNKNIAT